MRFTRRAATLAAGTALLAGVSLGVGAPAASAGVPEHPCDYVAYSNVSSGYGYLLGDHNLQARPAAECDSVAYLGKGTKMYYWCYIVNYYGNQWIYGRVAGTDTRGWESAANVSLLGTLNYC